MAKDKEAKGVYKSSEFLKKHGEAGTKFKYTDTKMVEVVAEDHKHYRLGKKFKTHALKAEALEEAGIVKILK